MDAYTVAFLVGTSDRLEGRTCDPAYADAPNSDVSQGYLEGHAVGTFTDLRLQLADALADIQVGF